MYTRQGYFVPSEPIESQASGSPTQDDYRVIPSRHAAHAMASAKLGDLCEESTPPLVSQEPQEEGTGQELYIYPPIITTGLDL